MLLNYRPGFLISPFTSLHRRQGLPHQSARTTEVVCSPRYGDADQYIKQHVQQNKMWKMMIPVPQGVNEDVGVSQPIWRSARPKAFPGVSASQEPSFSTRRWSQATVNSWALVLSMKKKCHGFPQLPQ